MQVTERHAKLPSLRGGRALSFTSLSLEESEKPTRSLTHTLKQENAQLTQFSWVGQYDTSPLAQALRQGSHALEILTLIPAPSNSKELLDMLRLKTRLQSLIVGGWKDSTLCVAEVLIAAPGINHLGLHACKLDPANLLGCAKALNQSALECLDLSRVKFWRDYGSDDELAQAVCSAPKLNKLSFSNFGDSAADAVLVRAFAENPAARIVRNRGSNYADFLPALLVQLNESRRDKGWPPLSFEIPPGACGTHATADDSLDDSDEDSQSGGDAQDA